MMIQRVLPSVSEVEVWRAAIKRAGNWLAYQSDLLASLTNVNTDFNWLAKIPWCLVLVGRRAEAIRLLNRVEFALDKGQLRWPSDTQWTNAIAYGIGWMVTGARACDRFAIARRFYHELQAYVCPETSALCSVPINKREKQPYFDASIQGAALHASISMGDLHAAQRLAELMCLWIDKQPMPDEVIFTHFHPNLQFLREYSEDTQLSRIFTPRGMRQPFANLGFVMQGLLRTSEATGEQKYQLAARRLMDRLLASYADDLLTHSQNHKVAHAAVKLYRVTNNEEYLQASITIARRVAGNIQPDGRALADIFYQHIADQPDYASIRTTCDSALWLQEICDEIDSLT